MLNIMGNTRIFPPPPLIGVPTDVTPKISHKYYCHSLPPFPVVLSLHKPYSSSTKTTPIIMANNVITDITFLPTLPTSDVCIGMLNKFFTGHTLVLNRETNATSESLKSPSPSPISSNDAHFHHLCSLWSCQLALDIPMLLPPTRYLALTWFLLSHLLHFPPSSIKHNVPISNSSVPFTLVGK